MQFWHLALLALLPLLFAGFRMVSEPYDPSRVLVENAILLGGVVFSSYSLLFMVIAGKTDGALPNLIKLYRGALARSWFLAITDVLLALMVLFLAYQLAFFRQVEFLSATDVEIYLGDQVGKPERLAFVRARYPAYLRLSAGPHLLVAKDVATQQWIEAQAVNVPGYFEAPTTPSVWINPKTRNYERTD